MSNKQVIGNWKGERMNMGATVVKQALPTAQVQQISPFLLLHHFGPTFAPIGGDPLDVGPHPHRGFEPVTFLYSGGIRHKDSRGNEGILSGGDVQWMTAGMGIIHSERASQTFLEQGGIMEGIQLWINLPAKDKMIQPTYQDIKSDQIPAWQSADGKASFRLVAGQYQEFKGPAKTHTPILALQLELQAGAEVNIDIPDGFQTMLYWLDGAVADEAGIVYEAETLLHFSNDGQSIALKGVQQSRGLLLAGAPIPEPLAQWGPFVMNTQTEIMEAMRDYQMGKMGIYIED
ncbi:MAG TPA: pirin family protein [Saprospiraceae bacterium]|nr:pirin family protein [Saprospiraceae bacterium]HMQ81730.1 pirin family protein [Saprospiraceae bacterium]